MDKPGTIHAAVKKAHERHAAIKAYIPGPAERFARLPVVAECATSGLPAASLGKEGATKGIPRSAVTCAKRSTNKSGWERIRGALGVITAEDGRRLRLAPQPDYLEDLGLDWHAVIHADGNGFGQVFLNFQKYIPGGENAYDNRTYVRKLRQFSDGLDACTQRAFRTALEMMARRWKQTGRDYLPVVPIILGGDDLTVVCDGTYAVQLARDYLRAFETEAAKLWEEIELVRVLGGPQRFSACAGVAIIKPHYPFYAAYELSEQLLKSAKAVKKHAPDCSALDYHILYDASGSELKEIRDKLYTDEGTTRLYARPYVVTPPADIGASAWAKPRRIDDLARRIRAMRERNEEGRRKLPNSTLHELREGLFLGKIAANARLDLAKGRHAGALAALRCEDGLYFKKNGSEEATDPAVTPFLDALDLMDFWAEEKKEKPS